MLIAHIRTSLPCSLCAGNRGAGEQTGRDTGAWREGYSFLLPFTRFTLYTQQELGRQQHIEHIEGINLSTVTEVREVEVS